MVRHDCILKYPYIRLDKMKVANFIFDCAADFRSADKGASFLSGGDLTITFKSAKCLYIRAFI